MSSAIKAVLIEVSPENYTIDFDDLREKATRKSPSNSEMNPESDFGSLSLKEKPKK